jgi:hypothetical protein
MLYFKLNTQSFVDTFCRLEEITFLKTITNKNCSIINSSKQSHLFDFSEFEMIEIVPQNIIRCNISDCVCVFDSDIYSIDGGEFLFYYPEQKGNVFRLDKFNYQDFEVIITKNNIPENKYFTCESNLYKKSLSKGLNFDISLDVFESYGYLKEITKDIPLFLLNTENNESKYDFDFDECYYIGDNSQSFLKNNKLVGHDLRSILRDYNVSHESVDINLLVYLCTDYITNIFGDFNNDLFNIILKRKYKLNKNYTPKIITKEKIVNIENFEMQECEHEKNFPFSRKNILCDRSALISKIRLDFGSALDYTDSFSSS